MRGSGDLIWGGGGRNPPPHLFEVLLVPGTQKMVPNPKTRRDKDSTTQKELKSYVKHAAIDIYLCHEFCLHFAPDRVPPYETGPILTTFALSRPDQMLYDCKK